MTNPPAKAFGSWSVVTQKWKKGTAAIISQPCRSFFSMSWSTSVAGVLGALAKPEPNKQTKSHQHQQFWVLFGTGFMKSKMIRENLRKASNQPTGGPIREAKRKSKNIEKLTRRLARKVDGPQVSPPLPSASGRLASSRPSHRSPL